MTLRLTILETLQALKPELVNRFFVSKIGLFGSVVRSDFSEANSDVDVVVEFSRPVGIEFIDLANFLEKKLQRKVDLISKKGIKDSYLRSIESDIIYV